MIILQLIQNIALLMALVMTQQLLANNITIRRLNRYPHMATILSGLIFGGVGIVGMMTPLHFAPGIIFDGRSIILAVAGLFGGPVVAALAAGMCGAYRLWLGGGGAPMGVSVICAAAALGVVFHYLRLHNPALMTNFLLLGFGFLVHAVMVGMMLLLPAASRWEVLGRIGPPVLLVFPVATMLICRLFISLQEGEKNKSALLKSEKNYRELVEQANSIILRWKPDGTITFFNEFAERFFGFSKEEILGQSVIGTIVPERDSANHDLRVMVFDIARNPQKYAKNENENICKDASRVFVSWTNKAIFDVEGNIREIMAVGNDITQRRLAEKALQESEKEFRMLTEAMPQIVWTTRKDGWNIYFNQQWVDYTGLPLEQSYGHGWNIPFHPDDQQRAWNAWENATKNGGTYSLECRLRRADGVYFWWLIRGVPFLDETGEIIKWFGTCTDIDSIKRAEEALRISEERYELANRATFNAIWDWNLLTNTLIWNENFTTLFGYQAEEIEPCIESWKKRIHPEDLNRVETGIHAAIDSGVDSWADQYRFHRKDGAYSVIEDRGFICRDVNGNPVRMIGAMQDITDRKRAEAELQAKNAELIHFNYTVSHDLKSPLVTIKTFLGYLEQDMAKADEEHVAQDLGFIHTAADRMNVMLEELLDLSRIGRVVNPPVTAPLQEIVQEALDSVAGRITERGVQVVVGQEPIMLYGERPRLIEVFQNLVDNAVKFMGDQPKPLVEIGAETKNGDIVCSVRDNGMGIDPRHMNKLFGMFEKLNADSAGTGLGLALVKRIVEVHGGRVWVESEGLGKGACFWFSLPEGRSLET